MRDWSFLLSSFVCDQMLLLYCRTGRKKIASVLSLMDRENVKPSERTYSILVDAKGRLRDREGIKKVVMTMKARGMEPNNVTKANLAKHDASFGMKERARALLEQIDGGNLKRHQRDCKHLLPLYTMIGEVEQVKRVWKICEMNPFHDEATAAIEAWGKLNGVEEADKVLLRMLELGKKPCLRQYNGLLRVHADKKMLRKGKELIKRMGDEGIPIGPSTWDVLVRLYVEVAEVEKANSILQKAAESQKKYSVKPLMVSYMYMMEQFAKRGDIQNTEKVFQRMREFGYTVTMRQFQALIQAYVNARPPAYGIG